MPEIYLTKRELAEMAGYSYRWLHNIDKDLPENSKLFVLGEGGKYALSYFVQRWVKYNTDKEADNGDKTLDDVRAEHEQVKIRKTELEVAKLEGRLVDIYDVRKLWGDVASTVTQTMLRLPSKVAPQLVMMKNPDLISDIIDREIRTALNDIADTPLPESNAESESEEEQEE